MSRHGLPCPVEQTIESALLHAGIRFIRDGEPGNQDTHLDFYVPALDLFIECKRFHTVRAIDQMKRAPNVILIQGLEAAQSFAGLVAGFTPAS